jgi:tRNA modification GTPase
MMTPPTYVSLLTPPGRGAVAAVGLRGPQALEIVRRHFTPASGLPLAADASDRVFVGRYRTPAGDSEELVVVVRGADDVEIHCHGGVAASEAIVESIEGGGAARLSWQEFLSATLADPIAVEARVALAAARTRRSCAILLDQLRGALAFALADVESLLAEGRRLAAGEKLARLASLAPLGLHLTKPWRIVVAGPPNVGKSSLINAILGYQRSIVFDEPGTTRDVLSAAASIDGWPVELVDTAGLRRTGDALEAEGVERARREILQADLILAVEDVSLAPQSDDVGLTLHSPADRRAERPLPTVLRVGNKRDLLPVAQQQAWREAHPAHVLVSARSGENLAALCAAISRRLVPSPPRPGEGVPFTARHQEILARLSAHV